MHIIIDIRSRHPEDTGIIRYAKNWVKKWEDYNPQDICTYLIFEHQEAPSENVIRVKPSSFFSPKKKLKMLHKDTIFRSVNFSRYAPYDASIPTISHIHDLGRWFYDNITNANILKRKEREYEIKKLLFSSSHIIVPNFFTGNELVEIFNLSEEKIDVLPYITLDNIQEDTKGYKDLRLERPYFLYDATFGPETGIEALIKNYGEYIKQGGKFDLVLHGNTHHFLTELTEHIRALALEKYVHITGCLSEELQESLYNHASAWVFPGHYNTSKTALALAQSKSIPCILSDIASFSTVESKYKFHPNHPELLVDIFSEIEHNAKNISTQEEIDEAIIFGYYKKILSTNTSIPSPL